MGLNISGGPDPTIPPSGDVTVENQPTLQTTVSSAERWKIVILEDRNCLLSVSCVFDV